METSRNISEHDKIQKWNTDLADVLIPNNVVLSVFILLGIIGNSVVVYVYKMRFTGKLIDRYFIPVLATTDLLAAV